MAFHKLTPHNLRVPKLIEQSKLRDRLPSVDPGDRSGYRCFIGRILIGWSHVRAQEHHWPVMGLMISAGRWKLFLH